MDNIAKLDQQARRDLFEDTAFIRRTTPAVIEKDFWVTWVLSKLYLDPFLSTHLVFKGGTSLSKVYKLIERFSEDIDLVLSWHLITDDSPELVRSKTKQQKFNQQLVDDADAYIKTDLLSRLKKLTDGFCELTVSNELCVINVSYPDIFSDEYLSPGIKLEIGPLASMVPSTQQLITSYAAETHPQLFKNASCSVNVITAERTFWEKVLILHQEHYRPENNPQPRGYSRHFYDVAKMAHTSVKDNALSDTGLLQDVIAFKQRYYPRAWARYDIAESGTVSLVPKGHILRTTKADYSNMKEMFFGDDVPMFDSLIDTIVQLEI